jgi:hypothetical protein
MSLTALNGSYAARSKMLHFASDKERTQRSERKFESSRCLSEHMDIRRAPNYLVHANIPCLHYQITQTDPWTVILNIHARHTTYNILIAAKGDD